MTKPLAGVTKSVQAIASANFIHLLLQHKLKVAGLLRNVGAGLCSASNEMVRGSGCVAMHFAPTLLNYVAHSLFTYGCCSKASMLRQLAEGACARCRSTKS